MKHLCWIFCCLLLTPLSAQQFRHEIQCIVPATVIHLESSGSALLGGKSVEVIELDLPSKTIFWYYRSAHFSSEAEAQKALKEHELSLKLDKILQKTDTLPITLPYLNLPAGTTSGTTYLLTDSSAVNAVLQRWRIGRPSYIQSFSAIEQTETFKKIKKSQQISGKQFLAISNPSTLSPLYTILEVVAVVQQEKPMQNNWKLSDIELVKKEIVHTIASECDTSISPFHYVDIWKCYENQLLNFNRDDYFHWNENTATKNKALMLNRCMNAEYLLKISDPDIYFLSDTWISGSGEIFDFYIDGSIQLFKKDGKFLVGKWQYQNKKLTLDFPNYKLLQYILYQYSDNSTSWKENSKGYFLELQRKN